MRKLPSSPPNRSKKMWVLYILYLEGGSKSPKRTRKRLARHFGAFFHHMKVRQQIGRREGFYTIRLLQNEEIKGILYEAAKNFKLFLKGHGNEADFLGLLQKLGPHRSLTLPFEPFRFWLQIHGDNRNRKTTPRLTKSGSRRLSDSASRGFADSPTRQVGESTTHRLAESGNRLLNV